MKVAFAEMNTVSLVVIGHLIKETIKFPEKTIGPVLGSPAAYSSVAVGRLGVGTGIVTRIGTDMPESLLEPLLEANVDRKGIKVGTETTTNLLIYDEKGDKRIEYLKQASNILFGDIPKDYLQAKVIFVCPINYEVPMETVRLIRKNSKATLAVDLGGYGGAASDEHLSDRGFLRELIGYFDIVKASSEDCRHILGTGKKEEEIASLFCEWGADVGIVTLGEKGAIMISKNRKYVIPAFPTKVVDCTGAGDVYCAGFFTEYLRTKDAKRSALFGNATASLMIEGTGGVLAERMPRFLQAFERARVLEETGYTNETVKVETGRKEETSP